MAGADQESMEFPDWYQQMFEKFSKHQRETHLCDTIIQTSDNQQLGVHSLILASACPQVSQEFQRNKGKSHGYILKSKYGKDIMELIVTFAYTGKVN